MFIKERQPGDRERLRSMARKERRAEQKDRLLSVLHALSGMETLDIARALCKSRKFVQRWAYAYRDGGIDAVGPRPRGGGTPRLAGAAAVRLQRRLDAGPVPTRGDKVCTLRGKDVQRIMKDELGAELSLSSVYRTLHRLGYSCLAPRPRHEKRDPVAQKRFKEEAAPLLYRP
jgi:transposase